MLQLRIRRMHPLLAMSLLWRNPIHTGGERAVPLTLLVSRVDTSICNRRFHLHLRITLCHLVSSVDWALSIFQIVSPKLQLFHGFRCWYGWPFSAMNSSGNIRKCFLDKSNPQNPAASSRFVGEPADLPWCGFWFFCYMSEKHQSNTSPRETWRILKGCTFLLPWELKKSIWGVGQHKCVK